MGVLVNTFEGPVSTMSMFQEVRPRCREVGAARFGIKARSPRRAYHSLKLMEVIENVMFGRFQCSACSYRDSTNIITFLQSGTTRMDQLKLIDKIVIFKLNYT